MGPAPMQSTAGNEVLECVDFQRPPSFCRRVAAGGHFFALTGTNSSTKAEDDSATTSRGTTSMFTDESAVYYPEDLSLFGDVLDQVVQSLPPNLRTPYNRNALAINILACASTGERDPDELRRAALMDSQVNAAA